MHNLGQQRAQGESVNSYHLCLAGLKKTKQTKQNTNLLLLIYWAEPSPAIHPVHILHDTDA